MIEKELLLNEYATVPIIPDAISLALRTQKMTTLGKLVFASIIAAMVTGKKSPFKLSGDSRKIEILAKAVQSSKNFQDEIRRPGASVDSVMRALDAKHLDAKNFKSVFEADWPL